MNTRVIPTIRYRDARAAIAWLCEVLGFQEHEVYEEDGKIVHAQLTFADGMIMLSESHGGPFDELQRATDPAGEPVTMSVYLILPEEEMSAHYARAVEKGARIVMPFETQDYGGSAYSCRDPEGQVWNFGSYDPFAEAS